MTTKYSLYHLPYCGFCHKVRRAASRLGIELELRDITANHVARRFLMKTLGRTTVPVLCIETPDGIELLPESDDIVAYLEESSTGGEYARGASQAA